MSGFFFLLSFYFWVRFRSRLTSHVSRLTSYFYLASLLAFLLGMLSKEVVITLPVVLWLYDLYFFHSKMPPTGLENPVYRDRRDIFRFSPRKRCPVPPVSRRSSPP